MRWIAAAAILTSATLLVTGCNEPPAVPPPSPRPYEQNNAAISSAPPTTLPADLVTAAQQQKTEEYVRQLEAMLKHRRMPSTQGSIQHDLNIARVPTSRPLPLPTTQPMATTRPAAPPPVAEIEIHAPAKFISEPIKPAVPLQTGDPVLDRVRKAAADSPRDAAANLDFQLVKLVQDQPVPDMALLASLASDDREIVSALMDGISNYRNVVRSDPGALLSKKVRPLLDMADRISAGADLRIPTAALCTRVNGYGNYETLNSTMAAGQENRALVYCEIAGFASRPGPDQRWETKLTEEVTLFRNETIAWKKPKPDPIVDRCRNRRHDFYSINLIALPASLPPGTYTLKVSLVDQIAGRVAETTLPITLAGAENVAGAK